MPVTLKEVQSMNAANKEASPVVERMVAIAPVIFGTEGDLFIVPANRDGMRNAGINNGDWLIFDSARKPESGDIVLLKLQGILLCRRIFFEENLLRIRREDGATPDLLANDADGYEITAVLIGSMRNYK